MKPPNEQQLQGDVACQRRDRGARRRDRVMTSIEGRSDDPHQSHGRKPHAISGQRQRRQVVQRARDIGLGGELAKQLQRLVVVRGGARQVATVARDFAEVVERLRDPPGAAGVGAVNRQAVAVARLGRAGLCRFDPDYLPLRVATSLLGGRFTSRLNLRLREELGLTYSISASQAARRGPAPFQIQSAVASESVGLATRETLAALERLAAEPAGERELAETVDYLVGTFAFTLQGLRDLAQHLENLITFDLPDTYFDQLHLELRAITPEQTRQVAERWLQPSSMTVVAVGPAESLAPQLEDLGEVEVVSGG